MAWFPEESARRSGHGRKAKPLPTVWEVSDELWERIEPLLAAADPPRPTGRPRVDFRRALEGVIFRLRSGVQRNRLPKEFGDDGGVYRRSRRRCADGVTARIRGRLGRGLRGTRRRGLGNGGRATAGWARPGSGGGGAVGPNPADRGKKGTKRSLVVEAGGGPVGGVIGPADRDDPDLLEATLATVVVERPAPTAEAPRNLCLDKGDDTPVGRVAAVSHGHAAHIRPVGEDREAARLAREASGRPPRRWVVERTIGWLSRCRALPVRYDTKPTNHLGLLQLACGLPWRRRLHRLRHGSRDGF